VQEAGVLDRSGADDDVGQAGVEAALDGVEVADAAAELHGDLVADFRENGLDGGLVLRLAGKGTIQIHHMQAPGTLIDPVSGGGTGDLRRRPWQRPFRLVSGARSDRP
jgi:hypothetical protein